jgi:integrase
VKRANGSGSVVRHKGTRRRPYEARVTTGRDAQGRQMCRSIGWYATRDEAMAALLAYNQSPYDIDARRITLAALFDRWYARATGQGRLASGSIANIKSAYTYCTDIADMPYTAIRAHAMQGCVDSGGPAMQAKIKNLFYNLDKYAMELDIINKRYSDLLHVAASPPAQKTTFSDFEVAQLWEVANYPWVDTVLILLYSGWRISELLELKKENIHIDTTGKTVNTMQGGKKTAAGKNRIVPIHSAILPLVIARYDGAENYLITGRNGKPLTTLQYYDRWRKVMRIIYARHTVHETRHTFRSWLDSASAPISCVNRIMGHVCGDIGLQVYTHKTVEQLAETIELIKVMRLERFPTC